MMNILGVLRPGGFDGKPMSYIHLEKSYPFTSFPDTVEIADAEVKLFRFDENQAGDTLYFIYTNFDTAFESKEYRNKDFYPEAGCTYHVSCEKGGYPALTSETIVPNAPKIVDQSLQITEKNISFQILRDPLVGLYDIYFITSKQVYTNRIRRPESGNISATINFDPVSDNAVLLLIYAYDLKLSEYITYNISIKPNTYRSSYSTVENGYGCFGSLNYLEKVINF
jgi:hypothetical protein